MEKILITYSFDVITSAIKEFLMQKFSSTLDTLKESQKQDVEDKFNICKL